MAHAPPCFILGSPRSGTTLLRRILDEHPDLAVSPETHFVSKTLRWARRGIRGGRNTDWDRFRRAVHANTYLDSMRPFFDETPPRDPRPLVRDVIGRIFSSYARSRGKSRWGEKTPHHIWFWRWIDELFPDARYLAIVRDGRDVTCSLSRKDWATSDLLANAARWKREWHLINRLDRALGDRVCRVWYEDLVRDPPSVIHPACAFLGLTRDPGMLERHEERHGAIHTESIGRHRRDLDESTVRALDALLGPELRAEGRYEVRSKPLGAAATLWVNVRAQSGLFRELLGKRVRSTVRRRSPSRSHPTHRD